MKRITIIIPYFNRAKALDRLMTYLYDNLDSKKFTFRMVKDTPKDEKSFNTGKVQNIGFRDSEDEWVFKQDVDCLPEDKNIYSYMSDWVQTASEFDHKIFGVKYLDKNNKIMENKLFCGNEYLVNKKLWERVGGVPEWEGYGYEDYGFEYKLEKAVRLRFSLPPYDEKNLSDIIRDNLTFIKNQSEPYFFLHYYHDPVFDREKLKINKKKLYELVKKIG